MSTIKSKSFFRIVVLAMVLFIISGLTASYGLAAGVQQQSDEFVVGILSPIPTFAASVQGFIDEMTERGYVDGENVTYIFDDSIRTPEEVAEAAAEMVEMEVDLIYTVTTGAAIPAQEATSDIPIVFIFITDPMDRGIVEDLRQPGGNITGIEVGPITERRLEILLDLDPSIEQLYLPYSPEALETDIASVDRVAEDREIEVVKDLLSSSEEIAEAIENLPEDIDAIFTLPDVPIAGVPLPDWIAAAIDRQIPLTHVSRVEIGPLMTFGPNGLETGKQAARLADQILQGTDPGELPIEVNEFALAINLVTAEAIDLNIPPILLRQAQTLIRAEDLADDSDD